MKVFIVKLLFNNPIHLSKGKMDSYESSQVQLRSDTIHSALYATALDLYGEGYAKCIFENVTVSSAFPFTGDFFWIPRPLSFHPFDVTYGKELKRKKFLRIDQFLRLNKGEEVTIEELISTPDPEVWRVFTTQRVLIDRKNNRGMPYYVEMMCPISVDKNQREVPFHKSQGLYLLLVMNEDFPWINNIFKFLGDAGMGLDKSMRKGTFFHEIIDVTSNYFSSVESKFWMTLSLFRPKYADINSSRIRLDKSFYTLTKRGGWIASTSNSQFMRLRKKSLMMFGEGSVFYFDHAIKEQNYLVDGIVSNVRPDWNDPKLHAVWRCGRSIFLPINNLSFT